MPHHPSTPRPRPRQHVHAPTVRAPRPKRSTTYPRLALTCPEVSILHRPGGQHASPAPGPSPAGESASDPRRPRIKGPPRPPGTGRYLSPCLRPNLQGAAAPPAAGPAGDPVHQKINCKTDAYNALLAQAGRGPRPPGPAHSPANWAGLSRAGREGRAG